MRSCFYTQPPHFQEYFLDTVLPPRGRVIMSAERNEALRRLAALGGTRTSSSVVPVARGYEHDTAS
jgi:hypothetical protein